MKQIIPIIMAAAAVVGCSSSSELARVKSPDGQACIVVTTGEKHGVPMPGPEPPRTLAKWARVFVEANGKTLHDTGDQDIGVYQSLPFAFDVAWAPDSSHVAYRMITTLRVVSLDGTVLEPAIPSTNSLISSFQWISDKELLVVVKEIDEPLDMYGYPQHYHGYLAQARNVKIFKVVVSGRVSERFTQAVSGPTFIFHSIGFENQEISPYSPRVAFSDGAAICVYDDAAGKVVAKAPLTGSLEGVWWEASDKLILGLDLLSSSDLRFASFDATDGKTQDCTASLLPLWNRQYDSVDWFKAGRTQPANSANASQPVRSATD